MDARMWQSSQGTGFLLNSPEKERDGMLLKIRKGENLMSCCFPGLGDHGDGLSVFLT